jgi:hypothetical protein
MISTVCPGHLAVVAKALQGGQAGDGHRRRLFRGEVHRLGRQLVLKCARVLGVRALADAEHLFARLEPGHVVADSLHSARQVRT